MLEYFDTDTRKLSFEIHEVNVSVISVSKAEGGVDQEVLIAKDDFLDFIDFLGARCKECLDLYPFCKDFVFGTTVKLSSSLEFCSYKHISEQKICVTFKGFHPDADDKLAIAFKFNFNRILEFNKFLLQFKNRIIGCEEDDKMEKSYMYKPTTVKAEPYKVGMEDGVELSIRRFDTGQLDTVIVGDTIKENGATVQDNVKSYMRTLNKLFPKGWELSEYRPFLRYHDMRYYIDKTDMIVTDALGDRFPMNLKVFKATFEEVEE